MKIIKRVSVVVFAILCLTSISYAFVLPQPARCLAIDFYDFERVGDLYFRPGTDPAKVELILDLKQKAEKRVGQFWGELTTKPKFIYCESDEDYAKFGSPAMTPAAAIMNFKSFVVLSQDGIDLDIIAHELAHTELFERVGMLDRQFEIPVWFDEGLAMQVDLREYYSEEVLRSKTKNLSNLPNVIGMNSYQEFGAGTNDQIMLNYMTARYEVGQWFTPAKLSAFIEAINNGTDFEDAYGE